MSTYLDVRRPAGATEEHLIEELVSVIWRKRRVLQAEGATINTAYVISKISRIVGRS
jgi:hypothetical protein